MKQVNLLLNVVNYGCCIADIFRGVKFHRCSYNCITEIIGGMNFSGTQQVTIGDIKVVAHYYIYSRVYFCRSNSPVKTVNNNSRKKYSLFGSFVVTTYIYVRVCVQFDALTTTGCTFY